MPIPAFYEIHQWPHDGRILIVDKRAHHDRPALTHLQVTGSAGAGRADATVAVAHALGAAAMFDLPGARVVTHDRHGTMLATPGGLGLPVTVLRRAR
jgi:hypothetical protein